MSIEQSIVNDVVDVKNIISDNWGDIITTADSIEKLITDGLEWVLAKDAKGNYIHLDQIKKSFEDVANTIENDLDLSTIEQDFDKTIGSVEGELNQYLKPMLSQIKNIKAEMTTEELFELIENSMPDIPGLSEVTEGLEDVLSPTKKILQELLKEGFSIKLKDLPLPAGATPSNTANGDNSLFEIFTSGLEAHMGSLVKKNEHTIEKLLTSLFEVIDKNLVDNFVEAINPLINKLEQGDLSSNTLINYLKTFISKEGNIAKNIAHSLITKTSNEIESLCTLISELLNEEIDNKIFQLIYPNHTCTLISITSLIIAIPLTLLDTSIDENEKTILTEIDANILQVNNEKDIAYGAMQLMDGFTMVVEIFPDLIPSVDSFMSDNNHRAYLWFNLFLTLFSIGFNIPAQVVSKPASLSDNEKKNISLVSQNHWQWTVWYFQWLLTIFSVGELIVYIVLIEKRPVSRTAANSADDDDSQRPLLTNFFQQSNNLGNQVVQDNTLHELPFFNDDTHVEVITPDPSSTNIPVTGSLNSSTTTSTDSTEPSSHNDFGSTVTTLELGLASVELAIELTHFILFIFLNNAEDNYQPKPGDTEPTDHWKKVLYYVDVAPGIVGNGFELFRLIYDLLHQHNNLKEKSKFYQITAGFEMIFDLGCQMGYGGVYIKNGTSILPKIESLKPDSTQSGKPAQINITLTFDRTVFGGASKDIPITKDSISFRTFKSPTRTLAVIKIMNVDEEGNQILVNGVKKFMATITIPAGFTSGDFYIIPDSLFDNLGNPLEKPSDTTKDNFSKYKFTLT